ncbi:hypothetical protein ACFL44_01445 [Gemmatimonadota bacterium]
MSGRPLLYYDIGELGWSMYLAAHLKYLHRTGKTASIIAPEAKRVFYRDCTQEILPVPEEWISRFGHYPSDGTHLYNPRTRRRIKDQHLLSEPFRRAYPDYDIITVYSKFEGERVFEPYHHSRKAEELCGERLGDTPVILIFPRRRSGKFRGRNIPRRQWEQIADTLCEVFSDCAVVAVGSAGGAWNNLKVSSSQFIDLVGWDDTLTLDMMVALCNTKQAIAAVGNQSGTVKITLLCGTPTYIFGHEKERHTVIENWACTDVDFWEVSPRLGIRPGGDTKANFSGYRISDLDGMLGEIVSFISDVV